MARNNEPDLIDDDAEEMQEELERSASDMERLRKALIDERRISARLREELERSEEEPRRGRDDHEEQHVIDFRGRLRRAWRYPNFRLFVFMLAVFGNAVYGADLLRLAAGFSRHSGNIAHYGPKALNALCIALFLLWSVAQFRKRGLAQMLLKWTVFFAAWFACELVGGELAGAGADWRIVLAVELVFVMVAAFTKISEWLGRQIRLRIWETKPVEVVKGWF